MVIVKPLKLYMFCGIFVALYYVLISMSIFTFKVCWKILCGGAFYFAETIQLIRDTSQVSGFCMVWDFTAKNVRADYLFSCFDINKLLCYVIFRKGSCTTDLLVPYLDADQWRVEIDCFINRIASNFFFCSYDARISF